MGKVKITAEVVSQTCIATDIYSLILKANEIASQAVAGQFVSVYSRDGSRMLPRPISLCGIDKEAGTLRLVYRIAGKGTNEFSKLQAGDTVDILGPLGNGFMKETGKAILIGGGIGIPPMLQLAKELDCEKSIVLGYRDELFLNEEFEPYGTVYLSSEDGMHGTKGNVIDAIKACAVTGDIVWTSSNEEVATVSASGASATVTAVGEGTATIKATITTDTGIVTYDKYDVTVVASDLVLEGDDLGAGASYTYVPNGFAQYSSMGIFEIDKSKLSEGTTISIKYTAMEGETDVKDTQGFNIGLKTGDKWNSPTINNYWGRTGGEANLTLTADDMKKIGADDKVYVHVGTATAGFKGTFTYLSVTAGEDALVSELPQAVSYVESGMAQWAPTAKVMLPSDIDFSKYSKCQIEFTASDPTFEFHGIVGHKVNGADVTDPKYGVTSEGYFEVPLSNVQKEKGTEPFVVINAGKAGYTGSVTITKITFVK